MANVLRADKRLAVLHHLADGSSIRSTERLCGVHRDTIMRLLVSFGAKCERFLDANLRNLELEHVQVDEQWTYVYQKNRTIPVDERRTAFDVGDQYLFWGVDEATKLIPSYLIGKRTADNCRRFLVDLAGRMVWQSPHATDAHGWQRPNIEPITRISSDQWPAYPEAIDLAFGGRVDYGQLRKDFRNRDMPGSYVPAEMVASDRRVVFGEFDPSDVCTSHVERQNLNTRLFVKRFNRLTLCFSKKLENLKAAVALYVAYHNFCWRPRFPGKSGRRRITPAMAAGVVTGLWSFAELIDAVSAH